MTPKHHDMTNDGDLSNEERSKFRRKMLEKIAAASPDPGLRKAATDILSGKATLQEAFSRSDVNQALTSQVHNFARLTAELSDEERQDLAAAGAAEIRDSLLESAEPKHSVEFDDDDDYFQRNNWMT